MTLRSGGLLTGFIHWLPSSRRARGERGFSLVETLAALLVFGIITLGLIPLLAGSIRGSDITRKATSGKQIVTEAMERARGLPFYIDYNTQPRKVDVLDLYFPGRTPAFAAGTCTGYLNTGSTTCTSTSYTATGPSYVTTCPNAANIACPQDLPDNYTLTFETAFVTAGATTPETYTKTAPGTTYTYAASGSDRPPVLLVELVVTARWTTSGRGPRTYQTRTLLADRRFSGLKLLGEATIDYAVKFIGGYPERQQTNESELTITAGLSTSRIETRRTATSSADVTAAELSLVDLVLAENATVDDEYIARNVCGGGGTTLPPPIQGMKSTQVAPPDATVNPSAVARTMVEHPSCNYDQVGGFDRTDGDSVSATVTSALPAASADFDFQDEAADDLWITQKKADPKLQLLNDEDWVARVLKSASPLSGSTSTFANALGTQPGVTSTATISFDELHLFRTDFIDDAEDEDEAERFEGAVVAITGPVDANGDPSGTFIATATCRADNDNTANVTPASVTYSGTLWYWQDPSDNNDDEDGSYQWVDLATGATSSPVGDQGTASDTLEAIQATTILVYDVSNASNQIHLFTHATSEEYLTDWSANSSPTTENNNNGRQVSARLDNALSLETTPIEGPSDPESVLAILVGAVSCRAEDNR